MRLLWEDRAWSDYLYWQTQDKKTLEILPVGCKRNHIDRDCSCMMVNLPLYSIDFAFNGIAMTRDKLYDITQGTAGSRVIYFTANQTVTVGWPAEQPEQVDRLPLEAIVHEEVYHDYTPQDIDRLYAYKESLPENKQFILENNKETLAQVFTDVRYTKKDSEAMSENLWKIMKKQGF